MSATNGQPHPKPPAVGQIEPDRAAIGDAIRRRLDFSEWVELRFLCPERGKASNYWVGRGDDIGAAVVRAVAANKSGLGVYATFNAIDSKPARYAKDGDVSGRPMLFIDIDPVRVDVGSPATETQRAVASAAADAVAADLAARGWGEPFERHDTGNGVALFYLCEPVVSAAAVNALLKALDSRHGNAGATIDTAVSNPSRVSRLPGTINTKGGGQRLCRVIAMNAEPVKVTAAMVADAVGACPAPGVKASSQAHADARADAAAYLAKCAPAVQGQDGSGATLRAARFVVCGFDLGVEAGFELMLAVYNPRCVPPWSERDLRRKCEEVERLTFNKPRGWLLRDAAKPGAPAAPSEPAKAKPGNAPAPRETTLIDLMRRDFPPARFYVAGLLPTGLTLLAGPPKGGKSWMGYQIAIAVAGSYRCFGGLRTEQAPVLYLALEDTERRLQSRAAKLLELGGWDAPRGLTLTCESAVAGAGGLQRLGEWYAANPGGLVLIDTLQRFRDPPRGQSNAYADDYAAGAAIQTLANAHGGAALVLHHTRKMEAENPFDRISGTQGIGGAADTMLVLDRRGNATQMFGTGRDLGLVTFALDFGGGLWSVTGSSEGVEPGAPATHGPDRGKRDAAGDWLAELLAGMPMPAAEVEKQAGDAGLSWGTVRGRN